jgi:hypothetical protein
MTQQMATTLIYGNTPVNPERFTGLAPRYNTVNVATALSPRTSSTLAAPAPTTRPSGS